MFCSISERRSLPAVCTAVTDVLVGVAMEAMVVLSFLSVKGELRSGPTRLGLVFPAVSFASPSSGFTEEGAAAGKVIPLLAELLALSGT